MAFSVGKYVGKHKVKLLIFIAITIIIVQHYFFTPFCCGFITSINNCLCIYIQHFHQLFTIQLSTSYFSSLQMHQSCSCSHSNLIYTSTFCAATLLHTATSRLHSYVTVTRNLSPNAFAIISSCSFIVRLRRYLCLSNCEMLDKLCTLLIAPSIALLCNCCVRVLLCHQRILKVSTLFPISCFANSNSMSSH